MKPRRLTSSSNQIARPLRSKFFGAASAAVAVLTGPIYAQTTRNWDAGVSDLWSEPVNWSGDILPDVLDTAAFNAATANQTIQLTGGPFTIQTLTFSANTSSAYTLQNGDLVVNNINQTADDSNVINPSVTIATKNLGTDVLTVNVTSNTLQLQGQITSGGLIKNGGSTVRLGTSNTAFNNAINGDIVINGGTFQAAAAATAGANNPLGGSGNVVIGNSGVTLELQAQAHYDFGRQVIANDRSFTLRGNAASGDPGDFNMTVGKVTIGNATMTTSQGAGYRVRTTEFAVNSGATSTVNTGAWTFLGSLSGDATTKIVKTGTSDLIIEGNTSNATNFAGDIDLAAGWLRLESDSATNQPLGNAATTINITGTANPILSLRAEAHRTFNGVNVNAGNSNFQLDVRRGSGSATNQTMSAGTVTIGNATMNLIGEQGFNAQLDKVSVLSGATATLNVNNNAGGAAQNLRINALEGDATSTLRKNGGQSLFISAADNSNFLGRIEINGGGTNQIEATPGNNPTANSSGITFLTSATLNLRSAEATDFGAPIDFGPGVAGATISVDRLGASGSNLFFGVGEINLGGSGLLNGATRTLTVNQGNSYDLATDAIRVDAGLTGALTTNTDVRGDGLKLGAGSVFIKQGGSTLILTSDNSATASGTIQVKAGTVSSSVAGSLGTGQVIVGDTVLNAAGATPNQAQITYGAAGLSANAVGADVIVISGGVVDLNATPLSTDSFDVQAHGRIKGTTAQLGALSVGSNLTLSPNAIIVHENPSSAANTVQNLANDANLFYGIGNNASTLPAVGVGTPWKGISGENTSRQITGGTISVHGGDDVASTIEVTLQSMFNANLEFTGGSFATTAAGGEKITLAVNSSLGTGFGNAPGGLVIFRNSAASHGFTTAVNQIIVERGGLSLTAVSSLGGVPVEVRDKGLLDIGSTVGNVLDGPVTFKSGGVFVFNDNQVLAGTGQLTFEGGSVLDITGSAPATFFTDTTQPINIVGTGHTVRFAADNITNLGTYFPSAGLTYVVAGGAATNIPSADNFGGTSIADLSINTQTGGLVTNGGVITNDTSSRGLTAPLTIGANGATFAATRGTNLVIGNDVVTTGNVQVGSLTPIDGRDKGNNASALTGLGHPDPHNSASTVWFTSNFSAANVTVQNHHVGFIDPDTTITGDLTVNGGVVYLDGGGSSGAVQGDLTAKLANGSLASRIILGNYTRLETSLNLGSDSNATVLQITQPFVIEGGAHPNDNRTMYVNRFSGGNTRVNFTNILVKDGAELAFDENNTDIRAAVKVAGNTTLYRGGHDDFDLLSLTRDISMPAFDGSNPAVVTIGKINQPGIQGFNTTLMKVYGEIGAGVQADIVRGEIQFTPSSSLNGVIRAHTAAAGGTAFIVSTSDTTTTTFNQDTTVGGTGRIELGRSVAANGPEDMLLRGTEVTNATAAQAPLHTHGTEIRIVNDGDATTLDGILRSDRNNDSERTARVAASKVVLEAGASVQFSAANSTMTVTDTTLQGNGTIEVTSGGVTLGAVNAGNNALTLQGTTAPTLSTPVTAGHLNVNGLTLTVDLSNVTGGLSVGSNGAVTATTNVAGALSVAGGSVSLGTNVANGLTVTDGLVNFTGTNLKTVAGPVSLAGANIQATGVVDFGDTVISSAATQVVGGLLETRIIGNVGLTAAAGAQFGNGGIRPDIRGANIPSPSPELYIYTGQFFDADGVFTFAENIDDNVQITIDGVMVLRNTAGTAPWVTATSTATTNGLVIGTGALEGGANNAPGAPVANNDFGMGPNSDGWHSIEVRLYNGAGAGGPGTGQGWTNAFGVGLNVDGTNDLVGTSFIKPVDPGDGSLFRATRATIVNVAANSLIQAGGMTNVEALNLNGANARLTLDGGTGPAVASSTTSITVSSGGSGTLEIMRPGDSLAVSNLNLTGSLTLNGGGDFIVTGAGSGAGALTQDGIGTLTVNGSINGSATVNGGRVEGNGSFLGGLSLNAATIAPGSSPGVLSASTLNATSASVFEFEIGSALTPGDALAGTHYDQFVITGNNLNLGSATLSLEVVSHLQVNDVFTLILNTGGDFDPGSFNGFANGALIDLPSGYQVQISYFDDASTPEWDLAGGNDVSLLVTVPEPGSAAILLAGLAALANLRRRQRPSA